jgi:regulator of sigma E protease
MPLWAFISFGFITSVAMAALGLGFVIFVHELGHFLVAKLCGVKCEKFYVGFDVPIRIGPLQLPRTLFRKQWGETEYGIGIIPLGGYVKMLGQDDNPANTAKEAERIRITREQSGNQGSGDARDQFDPRSYPAKTVPQRMAIISAGVIMNLIFAVIFGMVAYRMGVSYTPTVVGSTSPGLSAWEVGLQTGDRILQLGRDGEPSQNLRFDKDMMIKVMMTGAHRDMDLLVQRYAPPGSPAPEPEWITVTLSSPQKQQNGRPLIGIGPSAINQIGATDEFRRIYAHLPANQTQPALEQGDRIVGINGVAVVGYPELARELARRVDNPLALEIERPAADGDSGSAAPRHLRVDVPTHPVRWLGLQMTMGPISSVQQGSVAERAGLKVGDQLEKLNGEPILDPLEFPEIVRRLAGQTIRLEVRRPGTSEPLSLPLTPVEPTMLHLAAGSGWPVPVEALGIAYPIENTVARVVEGSPAAKAGIEPGDLIHTAEFVPDSAADESLEREMFGIRRTLYEVLFHKRPVRPIALGEQQRDWQRVHDRIQLSLPKTQVKLTYQRGDFAHTVEMLPVVAPGWFNPDRGLGLLALEEVHRVDAWATAFRLGWRETVESMRQVYFILYKLVSGQLSPTNLGGPAAIATMAGLEASESIARLLVFLTLLSANLAVINFLPIPVLDGGHAMFLLYEGVWGKPVNERVAFGLTMVGFCFVLGLMLFVIGLDVWRLSGFSG